MCVCGGGGGGGVFSEFTGILSRRWLFEIHALLRLYSTSFNYTPQFEVLIYPAVYCNNLPRKYAI